MKILSQANKFETTVVSEKKLQEALFNQTFLEVENNFLNDSLSSKNNTIKDLHKLNT